MNHLRVQQSALFGSHSSVDRALSLLLPLPTALNRVTADAVACWSDVHVQCATDRFVHRVVNGFVCRHPILVIRPFLLRRACELDVETGTLIGGL